MSDYKLKVRNPQNTGWINILKDVNIDVVDVEGNFVNTTLDQVLIELLGLINSKSSVHGGIFFTDVVPQSSGNTGGKTYSSVENYDLVEVYTSTLNIKCILRGITGWTNYKPNVTVNGETVDITIREDNPLWDGEVNITLTEPITTVRAEHEDGAYDEITVYYQEAPVVQTVEFVGSYPTGSTGVVQTELKEGDTFQLRVTTDIPITKIEVLDQGACQAGVFTFPATIDKTITVTIADRGDTATPYNGYIKAASEIGFLSDTATTTNTVVLNNVRPSATVDNIVYPIDPTYSLQQEALKDNEQAEVFLSFTETTSHAFSLPLNQLVLISPFDGTSSVFERSAGGYNITVPNLTIDLYRVENDTTGSLDVVVFIADTPQVIDITTDKDRLVSGGYGGTEPPDNIITITSDQHLLQPPTLVAPVGTFQGTEFIGGPAVWTGIIHIDDSETKGSYTWQNLETFNLAAVRVDIINTGANFEVGGFVARQFNVAAWPNRQALIGTVVTDVTKLICTNFSKGLEIGNFTYRGDTTNSENQYTIINSGGTWYNCDLNNAVSNTTGEMVVELEETP